MIDGRPSGAPSRRRFLTLAGLSAASLALNAACGKDPASSTVAQTRHGAVRGIASEGMVVWKGIPFAAPPTGARRFAAPEPAEPWTGIRDAT